MVKMSPSFPCSSHAAMSRSGDISEDLGSISVAGSAQQLGQGSASVGFLIVGL